MTIGLLTQVFFTFVFNILLMTAQKYEELFPFMNPCHPLTDKMCENISLYMRHKYREWDTYKGAKYSTFNITNELMRVAYDIGTEATAKEPEKTIESSNELIEKLNQKIESQRDLIGRLQNIILAYSNL